MAAETHPGCYRGPILIKYIFVILLQLQGKASAELGATTNEIKYFWMWVSAYRTLYLYLFGYHLELTAPSWYQDPLLPPGLNVRRAHPAKANAPHLRTSLQNYSKGCQRPGGKPQRGWSTHSEWRGNRAYIWKRDHFHSWTLLFFPHKNVIMLHITLWPHQIHFQNQVYLTHKTSEILYNNWQRSKSIKHHIHV